MNQYYIFEIQQYANGEYGHIVHFAFDEDPEKARLKAESKYHEVLAAAAVSELPRHAASLLASNGKCVMQQCYVHPVYTEPEVPAEEPAGDENE